MIEVEKIVYVEKPSEESPKVLECPVKETPTVVYIDKIVEVPVEVEKIIEVKKIVEVPV